MGSAGRAMSARALAAKADILGLHSTSSDRLKGNKIDTLPYTLFVCPNCHYAYPMDYTKPAEGVLYELWYSYAERLLARIVELCALDPDQELALREQFLRPNMFVIDVQG